jgi:hypothetical protein
MILVATAGTSASEGQNGPDPARLVQQMVGREHEALLHEPQLEYTSIETSDRTGGHAWTERVVEVREGRLRRLLLVDGKPLAADEERREESRLRSIAGDPQAFIERERARKSDEQRAEQMFDLLPRAFLFRDDGREQSWEKIEYRPNPAYEPRSYQERILHGMSGTMLIDPVALRLHMLQGSLNDDVSFGFGLLATIHRGSSLSITRSPVLPDQWKTISLDVHMNGYIMLFKALDRRQSSIHKDFKPIPGSLTIGQAVAILLQ